MKRYATLLLAAAAASALAQAPAPATLFEYDAALPLDIKETARREENGALLRDITYATLTGGIRAATLVPPPVPPAAPSPAILFVHWYGPPAPTSNRTQFLPDAKALAADGGTSLLVDTPWSSPEYFGRRTRAEDYRRSVQQVRDLRRALDVLAPPSRSAPPGRQAAAPLDPTRLAYVGHDFGAMYGTLAAAVDPRVT